MPVPRTHAYEAKAATYFLHGLHDKIKSLFVVDLSQPSSSCDCQHEQQIKAENRLELAAELRNVRFRYTHWHYVYIRSRSLESGGKVWSHVLMWWIVLRCLLLEIDSSISTTIYTTHQVARKQSCLSTVSDPVNAPTNKLSLYRRSWIVSEY
ncbi:hypothetical protein B0H11DRAFT_202691 [Mycena galericulata]|nr:hypothetical protein B0H11DRAFT_202691 [Mycena galericulata]